MAIQNTPPTTTRNRWTKILTLEMTIFLLKNDGEKWSRIFCFEIEQAPSELLMPSEKNGPERLNWLDRLAGISELAGSILE